MHRVVLLCLVLLTLISCSASTEIDPDLLYPLKIGVLAYDADAEESTLCYIQPGETVITNVGCPYEGADVVNLNLWFALEDGVCTLSSPHEDVQISRLDGNTIFRRESRDFNDRSYSFSESVLREGWLAAAPFGSRSGFHVPFDSEQEGLHTALSTLDGGEYEYYVTVEGTDSVGGKIVTARMKIVNLPKEDSPEKSLLFSITLEEYTLSDNYRMFLQ
jgi:lipoprotein